MSTSAEMPAGRDIDIDFDNEELEEMLGSGAVSLRDIGISRRSDLVIDGVLDYTQCPFGMFPPYEQIRQLEHKVISPEVFLRQADLDEFSGDEWLYLLELLPELGGNAPWEKLRAEGSASAWKELLEHRPEFADRGGKEFSGRARAISKKG